MQSDKLRKAIIDRLQQAQSQERYRAVFEFVVENKIPYTINSNGVFFNTIPLPKETLDKIIDIIKEFESSDSSETASTLPPDHQQEMRPTSTASSSSTSQAHQRTPQDRKKSTTPSGPTKCDADARPRRICITKTSENVPAIEKTSSTSGAKMKKPSSPDLM